MDLYYKLTIGFFGLAILYSIYLQVDLDFDLMKENLGFTESITKRKFKWYVLNGFIAMISFTIAWLF